MKKRYYTFRGTDRRKKALVDYNDLELLGDNFVYLKERYEIRFGWYSEGLYADEVKRIFVENGVNQPL